ncbi:MAG: DNA gyrase/topoisomerase IV subunit A, partial [Verrucomicrobia bacterium]|nr:DNA gyrase/topoisomerase IV subunit A [Cytophagales bacterium]
GEQGKIKIKKPPGKISAVEDLTSMEVEMLVHLDAGVSPDVTIDALYAFTDCEVSISPNACIIIKDKPHFSNITHILQTSTENTKDLLRQELEIRKAELLEKMLFASLEKIFIENRIYRKIEECETFELVIETVDKNLEKYKKQFYRKITEEDILRLLEIRIKRISKFDSFKADEVMKRLEDDLAETEDHLANIVRYTIAYFKDLLKKYGKGRERKTEIKNFETINITAVAATNAKLYVNRSAGFIGYGLKPKDEGVEYVSECSDIDEIIVFRKDGRFLVSKIHEKGFVGKDIIFASVFRKNDERTTYNLIYTDSKDGVSYVKRFQVQGITRDKEYDLTKGSPNSKILYFSANPNAEAEIVTLNLTANCKAKIKKFDYDFAELDIKGRVSQGNILTKYPVRKVELKQAGTSTLGGLDLWFDETTGRLNTDKRGKFLGNFEGGDSLLAVYKSGEYELTNFEITNRYDNLEILEKFNPETIMTAVYFDGTAHFVKRFKIETTTMDKKFLFISETKGSKLVLFTTEAQPLVEVAYKKDKSTVTETMEYDLDVIGKLQGWKAVGIKLTSYKVLTISLLNSEIPVLKQKEKSKSQPILFEEKTKKSELKKIQEKSLEDIGEMDEENPKKQLDLF